MSAEPKWTPGPWKKDGLRVAKFSRGVIAECPLPKNGGVFECVANSRLIAAAPELYEALSECMLHLPDFAKNDQPAIVKACEMARAALAKSRGES